MFPYFSFLHLEIVPGSSLNPFYRLARALPHVEQAVEMPLVAIHRSEAHPGNNQPIRGKYSGHVICFSQLEDSFLLADKTLELWEHGPSPLVLVPLLLKKILLMTRLRLSRSSFLLPFEPRQFAEAPRTPEASGPPFS